MAKKKVSKAVSETQKKVAALCDKALEKISATILQHYKKHPDSAWTGHSLVDLEKTIKAVYKDMGVSIGKTFKSGLSETMQDAYDKAVEDLKTHGKRNAILGKPNTGLVKQFMDSTFEEIAGRTTMMSQDHIRQLRNLSADVLRTAALTGASRAEVTRDMLARASEIPGFKFVGKNGAEWKNKTYFSMLARTELMNANRSAYDQKCAEEGCDVVELDIGGICCDACAKWEGKQFSLTGATKGLPTKQDLIDDGVFHPNCTHSYTAVPDWELPAPEQDEDKGQQEPEPEPQPEPQPQQTKSEPKPEPAKPARQAKREPEPKRDERPAPQVEPKRRTEPNPEIHPDGRTSPENPQGQPAPGAQPQADAGQGKQPEPQAKPAETPEEHKKRREEQRKKAFDKRKEKLRQDSEDAARQGASEQDIRNEAERQARKVARAKGLTGRDAQNFIQEQIRLFVQAKLSAFMAAAATFTKQYTPKLALLGKPPKIVFGGRANIHGSHYNSMAKTVFIKATGADALWHQSKGCVRHEFGHWEHITAVKNDPGLSARIRTAAQSDWKRLRDSYANARNLHALDRYRCQQTVADMLYQKPYSDLNIEERYNVVAVTDTIGSICNGSGYGDGHAMSYYKQQNHSNIPHSEALANIHALKNAFPDSILNGLFPELNRIVNELE